MTRRKDGDQFKQENIMTVNSVDRLETAKNLIVKAIQQAGNFEKMEIKLEFEFLSIDYNGVEKNLCPKISIRIDREIKRQ